MPKYSARSIEIRLLVAELAKTITPVPLTTLSKGSTSNADSALKRFEENAEKLAETSLSDDKDGCGLSFLGEHQGFPFLMVHARPEYPFNTSSNGVSNGGELQPLHLRTVVNSNPESPSTDLSFLSTTPEPPEHKIVACSDGVAACDAGPEYKSLLNTHQPQALGLRVHPKSSSFQSPIARNSATTRHDLKIDVYLNGDLCASSYVSDRDVQVKRHTGYHFAGLRDGRLTEKPWVLVPPPSGLFQDAADVTGPHQTEGDARNRWAEISDALKLAAVAQGRNKKNELPVSGQYLQSLATVSMPAQLLGLLRTAHKDFAIIDVVVITGKGNKDSTDASYLMRPIPLRLHGFALPMESPLQKVEKPKEQQLSRQLDKPTEQQPVVEHQLPTRSKKSFADQQIASQPFSFHHVPRNSADPSIYQAYRMGILPTSEPTNTPPTTQSEPPPPVSNPVNHAPQRLPRIRKAPMSRRRTDSILKLPLTPQKRSPEPAFVAATTEQKPSHSPTVPILQEQPPTKKRKTRTHYYDVLDTRQTLAEEMEDVARSAADKDAIFFSERRVTRSKLATNNDDLDIEGKDDHPNVASSITPVKAIADEPPTIAKHRGTKKAASKVSHWEPPALSKNSIVTYAEGDVKRQVRSERVGWFREEEVLVGVRFVVG